MVLHSRSRSLGEFYWDTDCDGYNPGGYHPVHLGDMFSKLPDSTPPRYRVVNKLGQSAFSTVWLARDLSDDPKWVALKFNVARISDSNNESKILHWLKIQPLMHPGRSHILSLLDSFFVYGPNGKHEVLVTDVVVPLRAFYENFILHDYSKQVCFQSLMGLAYLQELGVSHGDLHFDNLACAIPGLETQTESKLLEFFDIPECVPVLPRNPFMDTKSLPKYLVPPIAIMDAVIDTFTSTPRPAMCIKIIDFGNAFRPIDTRPPLHTMTPIMIRAPEIHFNRKSGGIIDDNYGLKSDVWPLACTMHEIVMGYMIFQDKGQEDGFNREDGLIKEMIKLCGELPLRWQSYWDAVLSSKGEDPLVPDVEASWLKYQKGLTRKPNKTFFDGFLSLLKGILCLDSLQRPSASELLDHPWFGELKKHESTSG